MDLAQTNLRSFVPELVSRRFARDTRPMLSPEAESLQATVLFADISSFTSLAEKLAQEGPAGPEKLSELLNSYFRPLIGLIGEHGGEVVKFAGDALLAVWIERGEGLEMTTCRAAYCAQAIQKKLGTFNANGTTQLSLHIGLGVGEVTGMHVGGLRGRWYYLLVGAPLTQVAIALDEAHSGDTVLSPEACKVLSGRCELVQVGRGCGKLRGLSGELRLKEVMPSQLTADAERAIHDYVPECVLSQSDTPWLAELRYVTALFLQTPDLDHTSPSALEQVQMRVEALQKVVDRYEGSIRGVAVDDKGPTFIVLFGLPPFAHEDDPVRAVHAAMEVRSAFRERHFESRIGIAGGRCFCGVVGGNQRREYTVIGEVMNLAARLMQASPINDILCDEETFRLSNRRFEFAHRWLRVRGKLQELSAHTPEREIEASEQVWAIKGRKREREQLRDCLNDLVKGESRIVVLEGEPGIGKSRLVVDLIDQALDRRIRTLVGSGSAIEQSTSYYTWRPVFNEVLGIKDFMEVEERKRRVLDSLKAHPRRLQLAPLMNAVLPLGLRENETTSQMAGVVRAESTLNLLVNILQTSSQQDGVSMPLLIVLEDAHWMDSSSWALANLVSRELKPLLLVVVTRPLGEELAVDALQLVRVSKPVKIVLESLELDDTSELVRERLGLRSMDSSIAGVIHERAEGNPFYSQEIAYALRDAGLIVINEGVCTLAPGISDLRAADFPRTIQGVIASRIDCLPPSQRLTLKVASVIGRDFDLDALAEVHPTKPEQAMLSIELEGLQYADLIMQVRSEAYSFFSFKHVITRDVAYNLLLFAQRRQLHQSVAERYERTSIANPAPMYPLLAYHWLHAGDYDKSLGYAEKSAEGSFRIGALTEAIGFHKNALGLIDKIEGDRPKAGETLDLSVSRLMALEGLGDVYFEKGQNRMALKYFDDTQDLPLAVPTKGRILRKSAECHVKLNEASEAVELLGAAEECEGIGQLEMGKILLAKSDVAYYKGLFNEAEDFLIRSEKLFEQTAEYVELGQALLKHATFKNHTHSAQDALKLARRAEKLLQRLRNPRFDLLVAEALSHTYEYLGQIDMSMGYAIRETEIAAKSGDFESLTTAYARKARLYYEKEEFVAAAKEARAALDYSLKEEFYPDLPYAKSLLALCEVRLGNLQVGEKLISEARALVSASEEGAVLPWLVGHLDLAQAELCIAENQWAEGNAWFSECIAVFKKFGRLWHEAFVRQRFGEVLVGQSMNTMGKDQFEHARQIWERLGNEYETKRVLELASMIE